MKNIPLKPAVRALLLLATFVSAVAQDHPAVVNPSHGNAVSTATCSHSPNNRRPSSSLLLGELVVPVFAVHHNKTEKQCEGLAKGSTTPHSWHEGRIRYTSTCKPPSPPNDCLGASIITASTVLILATKSKWLRSAGCSNSKMMIDALI